LFPATVSSWWEEEALRHQTIGLPTDAASLPTKALGLPTKALGLPRHERVFDRE
jgi:hypothetical protein